MPNDLNGLPLHPLVVHATVVVIPLAALAVAGAALVPRFRRWAGPLPMGLSAAGLVLVPLSTSTGETLERHVPRSALLERHTHLADGLLPWMIGLAALAAVMYGLQWRAQRGRAASRSILVAIGALALVAAAGTTLQVVRIGHSGAKAAWGTTDMGSSARP